VFGLDNHNKNGDGELWLLLFHFVEHLTTQHLALGRRERSSGIYGVRNSRGNNGVAPKTDE
jgi:hypothetical protein